MPNTALTGTLFQSTLPLRGVTSLTRNVILSLVFQSTLPLRGVTRQYATKDGKRYISIHTPLAGSDSYRFDSAARHFDFNPHSPCGE